MPWGDRPRESTADAAKAARVGRETVAETVRRIGVDLTPDLDVGSADLLASLLGLRPRRDPGRPI